MLERMIAPLIDNLLAEYGLTRADIIRLVSQGDDLANRARVAINTIAEHVASIEKRQGEIAEGLAILLADLNSRRASEAQAQADYAAGCTALADAYAPLIKDGHEIAPLDEATVENAVSLFNGSDHQIVTFKGD